MSLAVAATVFPVIFLGELPDKTMFASLVLASKGRPVATWFGVAAAFVVHVAIAVLAGVVLFHLVPHRLLEVVVGAGFLAGAAYSWHIRNGQEESVEVRTAGSALRTAATAGAVIFVAEWGDLTQILTADMAARYHAPVSVGLGAVVALWTVAALAVAGGTGLMRVISVRTLRTVTAVVLVGLGAWSLVSAL